MSSPPTSKRIKTSAVPNSPSRSLAQQQAATLPGSTPTQGFPIPAQPLQPSNPRKRRASPEQAPASAMAAPPTTVGAGGDAANPAGGTTASEAAPKKKGRTNTPWTAEEEQRLKAMRDAGKSWSEIAKTFPTRTEGSVKKHWYKDMHYAEFGEEESIALREAIKEYEANKWKVIGQKVGKPAKACEQYAKEHFKNL
ncbi:hypothetical protein VTN77DRAFT_7903 [Rasamsonia byssochlamydoides]|uniref:uncharacterized protein n=1 Tax=Rasamsonia byssochlamydoides TaxID=89139 RepID=UPI003743EE4D